MSSIFLSASTILLNKLSKFKSQINTQLIGEIAPPRTWYCHVNQPDCSIVSKSKYSSTTAIKREFLFFEVQILQIFCQTSVSPWQF